MRINDVAGIWIRQSSRRKKDSGYHFNRSVHVEDAANSVAFLVKGELSYDLGEKRFTARKNDLVCLGPKGFDSCHSLSGHTLDFRIILFDLFSFKGEKLDISQLGVPTLLHVNKPKRILSMLAAIQEAFNSRDSFRLTRCSVIGLSLLEALVRDTSLFKKQEPAQDPLMHFRIREALEEIEQNYKKRLDLKSLAKRACMHPAYFAHLFKQEVGIPPHRYILQRKINKAKDFLCQYSEPLVYTATELGFQDYSHFRRTFMQIAGETPREFIRKNKAVYDPR